MSLHFLREHTVHTLLKLVIGYVDINNILLNVLRSQWVVLCVRLPVFVVYDGVSNIIKVEKSSSNRIIVKHWKGTYHAKCTFLCLLCITMCPRCVRRLTKCQKIKPSLFSSVPTSLKTGEQWSWSRFASDMPSGFPFPGDVLTTPFWLYDTEPVNRFWSCCSLATTWRPD